jgi:hypothetical protein
VGNIYVEAARKEDRVRMCMSLGPSSAVRSCQVAVAVHGRAEESLVAKSSDCPLSCPSDVRITTRRCKRNVLFAATKLIESGFHFAGNGECMTRAQAVSLPQISSQSLGYAKEAARNPPRNDER